MNHINLSSLLTLTQQTFWFLSFLVLRRNWRMHLLREWDYWRCATISSPQIGPEILTQDLINSKGKASQQPQSLRNLVHRITNFLSLSGRLFRLEYHSWYASLREPPFCFLFVVELKTLRCLKGCEKYASIFVTLKFIFAADWVQYSVLLLKFFI